MALGFVLFVVFSWTVLEMKQYNFADNLKIILRNFLRVIHWTLEAISFMKQKEIFSRKYLT